MITGLSMQRTLAVFVKEFQQMMRDRLTFAMAVGVPVLQLLLFGYAINTDPKGLPTAVVSADPGPLSRAIVAALQNTGYMRVTHTPASEAQAEELIARGVVQFMVAIPPDFTRRLVRGERPALLVSVDATDPSASGNAVAALAALPGSALMHDAVGPMRHLAGGADMFEWRIHRRYNPEGLSRYNIVPGLVGVVLTMTMVMLTGLAMTRERERGTFENLLSTPAAPIEVMTGKIVPYILIGLIQVTLIILCALWLFHVPMQGSYLSLYFVVLIFIAANLTLGITFSSIARNQLQAMQMTFFFFLPSILLSGFMFPFRGMPEWAQWIGSALPLTHFVVLVRGIMLKGSGLAELWPQIWPILAFMLAVIAIGLRFYKRTLD
jgi:ABC-2 type transport system permease protein